MQYYIKAVIGKSCDEAVCNGLSVKARENL